MAFSATPTVAMQAQVQTGYDPRLFDSVVIETGVNARQALSHIAAATAGKIAGQGTGTVTIKGINTTTTRIVATTDVNNNRTAITLTSPS